MDPTPYRTFATYGGDGAQFTSPDGRLCRIVIIRRGQFAYVECFGDLHGTAEGSNFVKIGTSGPDELSTITREGFLGTGPHVRPDGVTRVPTGAAGFVPLPAGSSLTFTESAWSGTCAVDAAQTSCTVKPLPPGNEAGKSFVLNPTSTKID